ncbi:hypothetical protein VBZ51_08280 [Maribacter sp. HS]
MNYLTPEERTISTAALVVKLWQAIKGTNTNMSLVITKKVK